MALMREKLGFTQAFMSRRGEMFWPLVFQS